MDLRTESLNFNAFLLFICLFLTADRLSPHALFVGTCRLVELFLNYSLRQLKFVDLEIKSMNHMKRRQYVLV